MNYIIIIIIILIIFLITTKQFKRENYKVNTDYGTYANIKNIGEIYPYPACVTGAMCVTSSSKLKPYFTYNLSDGIRCVHNNSNTYDINKSELDNLLTYSVGPNVNFTSCQTGTNTMLSYVTGRYIKILRLDNTPIRIRHISVYNRDSSNLSLNKTIYVNPIYTDSSGNVNYSDPILNSSDSLVTTFQTGTTKPYIQIDLGNNLNISYIDIKHNDINDATSLNSAYVIILDDDTSTDTDEMGNIKFIKQITDAVVIRRIYTYPLIPSTFPTGE